MTPTLLDPPQSAAIRALLIDEVQRTAGRTAASGTAASGTAASRPPRLTARRAVRRIGVGALAAGAVAAALVVANLTLPHAASTADASELLRDAAAQTITATDPIVGHGQYLEVSTAAAYLALTQDSPSGDYIGYVDRQNDVVYFAADADTASRSTSEHLKPTVFYGDGAEAFADADWASYLASRGQTTPDNGELGGGTGPAHEDLATLPRDPAALLDYLRAFRFEAGPSDSNVFDHVVSLLRDGRVPADLRAALYRALALVPAVSITAQQAVLDGRTGTAFGLKATSDSARQEIIIDTTTGQYLGERQVLTRALGAVPAGTPMEWTAVTVTVVDGLPSATTQG